MSVGISAASTEYVAVIVKATSGGATVDPTGFTASLGFVPSTAGGAQPTTWYPATWVTGIAGGQTAYYAQVLVGPAGAFVTAARTNYSVWVMLAAGAETPVLLAGELRVI